MDLIDEVRDGLWGFAVLGPGSVDLGSDRNDPSRDGYGAGSDRERFRRPLLRRDRGVMEQVRLLP